MIRELIVSGGSRPSIRLNNLLKALVYTILVRAPSCTTVENLAQRVNVCVTRRDFWGLLNKSSCATRLTRLIQCSKFFDINSWRLKRMYSFVLVQYVNLYVNNNYNWIEKSYRPNCMNTWMALNSITLNP